MSRPHPLGYIKYFSNEGYYFQPKEMFSTEGTMFSTTAVVTQVKA
jgi:hypothetical protein